MEALAGAVEVQSVVGRKAGGGELGGEVLKQEVDKRGHAWFGVRLGFVWGI